MSTVPQSASAALERPASAPSAPSAGSARNVPGRCRPGIVPLLDAPLADLLCEYDVKLVESSITDREFLGAFVEGKDGRRALSMPTGRSGFERDTAARMLLAKWLQLDAPPLPAPLTVVRP